MDTSIALIGVTIVYGFIVVLLKRVRKTLYPPGNSTEDYGFHLPQVGGEVWSFGAYTRGDAMESAEGFVEGVTEVRE